jgi:hypothetical protein
MRTLAIIVLLVGLSSPAVAEEPGAQGLNAMVSVGVGIPELLHAELGYFPTGRLSLEAQFKSVVFNTMVGVGATGHLLGQAAPGRPPRHSLLASGSILVNPTLGELRLESGGDVIAAGMAAYVGYGFLAESGFLFRGLVGTLFYEDDGLALGPVVTVAAGWAF